jgi:hypothetical protein
MSDNVSALILVGVVFGLIFLDVATKHKFGDKLEALRDMLWKFVFSVAIVAGIGWGVWQAGSWVFSKFNDDNVMQYEEGYEEGYYDALDCVKRQGGSASAAVTRCK